MRKAFAAVVVSLCSIAVVAPGCQTVRTGYYNAWEKFGGYAKRERLVDNVKAASAEQGEAKKEFATALEQFKSVVNFSGGDLEKTYNKLNDAYEDCESRAAAVDKKVAAVKNVANALFAEWQTEIGTMKDDASLQAKSQELLDKTKSGYGEMIARMDAAAATMPPVLSKFKNRTLFIKHNLNAQAIASLKGTELELGNEIDNLIKTMEASIKEADEFIAENSAKK